MTCSEKGRAVQIPALALAILFCSAAFVFGQEQKPESPADQFQKAYALIREADRLRNLEEEYGALANYRGALTILDTISLNYPDWNQGGIQARTDYCKNFLWQRLPDAAGDDAPAAGAKLTVSFIDVGQGDCILAQTSSGKTALIDGGRSDTGPRIVSFLRKKGVQSIDLLIATHPDHDHCGGLLHVVHNFKIGALVTTDLQSTDETYYFLLETCRNREIMRKLGWTGNVYQLGEATLTVLNPSSPLPPDYNEASIVARLTCGEVSVLLTGDAPEKTEEKLAESGLLTRCQVMKAAHHGSKRSTGGKLLRAIKPEVAVISVGEDNLFGHPAGETLDRLGKAGVDVFRTDRSGDIIIETDGRKYRVLAGRGGGEKSPAGEGSFAEAKLNINQASVSALQALELIGPKRAQDIVDYRQAHGPFKSIEELTQVKGIGPKIFERNKHRITVEGGVSFLPPSASQTGK